MQNFYPVTKWLKQSDNRWILENEFVEMETSIIYEVSNSHDEMFILKYIPSVLEETAIKEFENHEKCATMKIAPEIIEAWLSDKGFIMIIRKLTVTVSKLLSEYKSLEIKSVIVFNIFHVLKKMHFHNIFHGDTHTDNFMAYSDKDPILASGMSEKEKYNYMNYKYYAIDFGLISEENSRELDYSILLLFLKHFFSCTELRKIFEPLKIFAAEQLDRLLCITV